MFLSKKERDARSAERARSVDRNRILGQVESSGYGSLSDDDFYKALKHTCKYAGPPDGLAEALIEKCQLRKIGAREIHVLFLSPKDCPGPGWAELQRRLIGHVAKYPYLASGALRSACDSLVCGEVSYSTSVQINRNPPAYELMAEVAMDGRIYTSPLISGFSIKEIRQLAAVHLLCQVALELQQPLEELPTHIGPPIVETPKKVKRSTSSQQPKREGVNMSKKNRNGHRHVSFVSGKIEKVTEKFGVAANELESHLIRLVKEIRGQAPESSASLSRIFQDMGWAVGEGIITSFIEAARKAEHSRSVVSLRNNHAVVYYGFLERGQWDNPFFEIMVCFEENGELDKVKTLSGAGWA